MGKDSSPKIFPPLIDIEKAKLQSELENESEKARKYKADFDQLYVANQLLLKEKTKIIHDEDEKRTEKKVRERTNEMKEEKVPIPITIESAKKRRMSNSSHEDVEV